MHIFFLFYQIAQIEVYLTKPAQNWLLHLQRQLLTLRSSCCLTETLAKN